MDLLTLLIVILLLLWLFGYFGRGRLGGRGFDIGGGNWVHTLLVIVLILVVLRVLGIV